MMVDSILLDIDAKENNFEFSSTITEARSIAELELYKLEETLNSIEFIRPECDRTDYALAISSGAICGIIDIFLVGKPGESPFGDITDQWFEDRTKDFAQICGWSGGEKNSISSAIKFLEKKFKVPYDQTGTSGFLQGYGVTPTNHHFKSLAHNPSLLGLFFSILDQFWNTSHFVAHGELISLQQADNHFELQGNNILSKLFCGFYNWFGHLMSDVSGASGSKGRGMGIPSPLWDWVNDVVVIKNKLNIPVSDFDMSLNEMAAKMFNEGYDIRFQTAQMIPVLLNELIVRLFYLIRRILRYYGTTEKGNRSLSEAWKKVEPFSNPTIKKMLTLAHGAFCLVDVGDAATRSYISGGGVFNPIEFFMRLNVVGVGRFTISLYGEGKRGLRYSRYKSLMHHTHREEQIIVSYIDGLNTLYNEYDDRHLLNLIRDFSAYYRAFDASVDLAEKRHVPEVLILRSKQDGDSYFRGGKS